MRNPFFRFKQFVVWHDRCAMKVGTDGVLLGAWTEVGHARKVLDIGTGSGLIALMIAQRSNAEIVGIDIDAVAVGQATENVKSSPWGNRVKIEQADITDFNGEKYDVIVSNPPYFQEEVHCPDGQRNVARHTSALTFESLLDAVEKLLTEEGCFSVILPAEAVGRFITLAAQRHLYLVRRTDVQTKPALPPKRALLAFGRTIAPCQTNTLVIESEPRVYSPEFIHLVKDFYLAL